MNLIHVLDENTANKIAAGEVVERPASIVKELVENSIDAKSSNIEIEIADGGISFIRITDDGGGMSYDDAQLAILRHATSKISVAEDLSTITSLGFRGEALPSIAAVSKFSLTTRLRDNQLATYVEVVGGLTTDIREAGGNVGTSIIVKDLFFNTPARKKFLKTPSTESSHIHDIITKIALSNPNIAFKLINNNRLVLSTPGNNQLQDTLTNIYGQKIAPDLLPIDYDNTVDNIKISGYLSKPTLLKSSRQWQTVIVNARVINSRSIAKALDNAYHSLLPKSGYPLAVLNLSVLTDTIDVNVHPQKSEIKFSDEQKIFRAVYKAVVDVLSAPHTPDQLAATVELKPTSYHSTSNHYANNDYKKSSYNHNSPTFLSSSWQETPLPLTVARNTLEKEQTISFDTPIPNVTPQNIEESQFTLYPLGQVDDCFIISKGPDGLYIIDQHAAHERILYDKMSQYTDRIPSQQLLVPSFIDFDAAEINIISEYHDSFYKLGFTLELVGPNTMRLSELPSDIPLAEIESSIRQILEYIQNMHNPSAQELRHNCLQIAACRAAIKAGESLNMRQMQALINELCNTNLPYTCPHGRPAMIRFSPNDLYKMFKRT
jgi:DNA mismatch repair protein MutL